MVGTKNDLQSGLTKEGSLQGVEEYMAQYPRIAGHWDTSAKDLDSVLQPFTEVVTEEVSSLSDAFIKDNSRGALCKRLDTYIARIEGSDNQKQNKYALKPDFSKGFWFFKQSRALNREANYELSKKLKEELRTTDKSIEKLLDKDHIKKLRNEIIEQKQFLSKPGFSNRGINSSQLNDILNGGLSFK